MWQGQLTFVDTSLSPSFTCEIGRTYLSIHDISDVFMLGKASSAVLTLASWVSEGRMTIRNGKTHERFLTYVQF